MTYKPLIPHSLRIPSRIAALLASPALLAPGIATPALAQTSPTHMDWPTMMWGMTAIHILGLVVLILAAAALIKYLFFR